MIEHLTPVPRRLNDTSENASPGLKALLDQFGEDLRHGVLDLGPAVGANVEYFSRFSCKLYIADVLRSLEAYPLDPFDEEADWGPVFAEVLPYERASTRFDVVLAWDVLNYLRRRQIQSLALRLSEFCRQGTLVFALVSTRREIPARPRSYHILGPERLLYQSATQAIRPGPLYREPELLRLMPGYSVSSTFLLRNGMQEYLLTCESGPLDRKAG